MDRVIVLVDMDCFYVQVEQRYNPELIGKPCAVVQYNEWKGGAIIAVNYEARDLGVSRFIRGNDAKKLCPEIELVRVPEVNGKADLTKYRNAGKEVIEVISRFGRCIERASIDEAYIDLTEEVKEKMTTSQKVTADQLPGTYVVGYHDEDTSDKEAGRQTGIQRWLDQLYEPANDTWMENDRQLVVAATIVQDIRTAIEFTTGFRCSAGIAHNKMLSKLACGLHKPNRQTVLPQNSVSTLFMTLPLSKVRNLGGKLGKALGDELQCKTMADITWLSKEQLKSHFGEKTGLWLYDIGRGIDHEPVRMRQLPQSIGCSKNFPGKNALTRHHEVKDWLERLASEIYGRLLKDRETNDRIAKSLTVHLSIQGMNAGISRTCGIFSYNVQRIAESAYNAIEKLSTSGSDIIWAPPIISLGMSAGKFQNFDGLSTSFMQKFLRKSSVSQVSATLAACAPKTANFPGDNLVGKEHNFDKSLNSPENIVVPSSPKESERPLGFFSSKLCSNSATVTSGLIGDSQAKGNNEPGPNHNPVVGEIHCQSAIRRPDTLITYNNIDPDVLISLPEAIQVEIRTQLSLGRTSNKTLTMDSITRATVKHLSDYNASIGKDGNLESIKSTMCGSGRNHNDVLPVASSTIPSDDTCKNLDTLFCEKCNEHILVWNFPEHTDYHLAVELQSQMNESLVQVATTSGQKATIMVKVGTKRKSVRKEKNIHAKDTMKKVKSISSFFSSSSKDHSLTKPN